MTHQLHPAERSYSMPIICTGYGEDDGPDIEYETYEPDIITDADALDRRGDDEDEEPEDDDSERAPLDIIVIDDDSRSDLPEGTSLRLTLDGDD